MRLGGPVFGELDGAEGWIGALRDLGYSAAYCPLNGDEPEDVIRSYASAAGEAGVVIAEVGAWGNNPVSPDEATRRRSVADIQRKLALAELIGARCCVNVSGSRGEGWAGPHPENLTDETFGMIVESVREIIDGVDPTRTCYTLEMMQWAYPDSPDSCLRLIEAVDREAFAVHLDPTNLVCSPRRYYANAQLIRECFGKLGPHIRSCHAKDVALAEGAIVHLDEVLPGTGALDYRVYLEELSKLDADTPLMIEHLKTAEEYRLAAGHIRAVAAEIGVEIV